jgi:hypothetical protein
MILGEEKVREIIEGTPAGLYENRCVQGLTMGALKD